MMQVVVCCGAFMGINSIMWWDLYGHKIGYLGKIGPLFQNCRRLLVYNMGGSITQIGTPQIPVYVSGEFGNVGLGGVR